MNVSGTLYDVEFVDSTCVDAFTGCNSAADFAFSDITSASAAAQALLTDVFIDGTSGDFDSHQEYTFGCTSTFICEAIIPFPILILQGHRDYQVRQADMDGWRSALQGRSDVTIKSYPTLNHLFMVGEGKATPAE